MQQENAVAPSIGYVRRSTSPQMRVPHRLGLASPTWVNQCPKGRIFGAAQHSKKNMIVAVINRISIRVK
jgi:hypothetical protein